MIDRIKKLYLKLYLVGFITVVLAFIPAKLLTYGWILSLIIILIGGRYIRKKLIEFFDSLL